MIVAARPMTVYTVVRKTKVPGRKFRDWWTGRGWSRHFSDARMYTTPAVAGAIAHALGLPCRVVRSRARPGDLIHDGD